MRRGSIVAFLLCIVVVVAGVSAGAPAGIRVLLVDETKTLGSTMRVAGLVGGLKAAGPFDVSYRLADVESSWDDPLAGADPTEAPYDLIVIVSRGIDDGSSDWIWILSDGLYSLSPLVRSGIGMITALIDRAFGGEVRALGIYDDLFLTFLSALYVDEGWLR